MSFEMVNSLILFGIGFYILIKGANILIRGAVSIAKTFNVSNWFIGSVIVSAGTSIPELSINIASVFNGYTVGVGTVLGSNIFNILIVLGVGALLYPITMRREWVVRDFIFNFFTALITGLVILFPLLGDPTLFGVTREEGVFLFAFLFFWFWRVFRRKVEDEEEMDIGVVTIFVAVLMFLAGIVGVFLGGKWVVDGASTLAIFLGISPAVVGLSVVAVGTSLPELVVSVVALAKGVSSIAVGNAVGSSIFNLLAVLGITAMIDPFPVYNGVALDLGVMLATTALLVVLMFVGKRYTLSRPEGVLFIVLYAAYVVSLFIR